MTTTELQNIVARHEMQCLELKESFNVESIETACAFANANGGYIVIGVDNKGQPSKHGLRIEAAITRTRFRRQQSRASPWMWRRSRSKDAMWSCSK